MQTIRTVIIIIKVNDYIVTYNKFKFNTNIYFYILYILHVSTQKIKNEYGIIIINKLCLHKNLTI